MKRFLSLAILLCAASAFGASPVTPCVETNGWVVDWNVAGIAGTNGGFAWGFGPSNSISSTQSMTVVRTTKGFNWDGTKAVAVSYTLTTYGGKQLRFPYPLSLQSNPTNYVTSDGSGGVNIRSSLLDYIFAYDTLITYAVRANAYSNMSAITTASLVNNSTLVSPAPFAQWCWPDHRQITNSTVDLHLSAWHWAATNGLPLCAIAFVVQDLHSHIVTNWVNTMTNSNQGDAINSDVYIGNVDISTMTEGDQLKCDAYVYPWLGTNVLYTGDGINLNPPNYCSQTNLCDRTGAYGNVFAIVDPVNGNNSTAQARRLSTWPTRPLPFATVTAAAVAIKGTNNQYYSHLDIGGGYIYLTNGTHDVSGAGAYGTNAWAPLIVTKDPAASISNVFIGTGDGFLGYYTIYSNVQVTNNSGLSQWSAGGYAWFDQCVMNDNAVAMIYVDAVPWYCTRSWCLNMGQNEGFNGFSSKPTPCAIVRGNVISIPNITVPAYCTMGNLFTTGSSALISDSRTPAESNAIPAIVYDNYIKCAYTSAGTILLNMSNNIGAAVVQNIVECTNSTSSPVFSLWADGITNSCVQLCLWYNTGLGQRLNLNYDSTGGVSADRRFINVQGNIFEDYNLKSDLFSGAGGENGGRIGNWAGLWGVGYRNNLMRCSTIGAGFLNSSESENFGFDGVNALTSFPLLTTVQFVDREAAPESGTGTGNGNYRLRPSSPLYNVASGILLLPHDIAGRPRSFRDAPGAYAFQPFTILTPGATTILTPGATTVLQP